MHRHYGTIQVMAVVNKLKFLSSQRSSLVILSGKRETGRQYKRSRGSKPSSKSVFIVLVHRFPASSDFDEQLEYSCSPGATATFQVTTLTDKNLVVMGHMRGSM